MSEEELKKIRDYIVENIARNPHVFIKCLDIDVPENLNILDVIVGLYDMLHKEVTGENYDYMWHWANKIGFWCDDGLFYANIVKGGSDGKET